MWFKIFIYPVLIMQTFMLNIRHYAKRTIMEKSSASSSLGVDNLKRVFDQR